MHTVPDARLAQENMSRGEQRSGSRMLQATAIVKTPRSGGVRVDLMRSTASRAAISVMDLRTHMPSKGHVESARTNRCCRRFAGRCPRLSP